MAALVRLCEFMPRSTWTPAERLLALCLASHLGAKGTAWPSLPRVMVWTGLSRRTIQRALRTLCEGTAAVFVRDVGLGHQASRYRLRETLPEPARETPRETLPDERRQSDTTCHSDASEVPPRHPLRGVMVTPINEQVRNSNELFTEEFKTAPASGRRKRTPLLERRETLPVKAPRETWLTPFGDAWLARWGAESRPPFGELARALKLPEATAQGQDVLVRAWTQFLQHASRPEYARPLRFVEGLGQWVRYRPKPDRELGVGEGGLEGLRLHAEIMRREREGRPHGDGDE